MANKEKKREYMKVYNQSQKAKQSKAAYNATERGKKIHREGLKRYYAKIKGIYGIFDAETSECLYIGGSGAVNNRINIHRYAINHLDKAAIHRPSQFQLYQLLASHNSVMFEILDECDKSIVGQLEQFYINIYNPKYNSYKHNDKL